MFLPIPQLDASALAPPTQVRQPTNSYQAVFKRLLDLLLVVVSVPVWGPLLLLLLPVAWLSSGGSPIFGHTRIGRDGRRFRCLKLRTMVPNSQRLLDQLLQSDPDAAREWSQTRKLRKDPRITRVGAFLRATSLDEVPQLINVLRGDMTLVGPRPITEEEVGRYGSAAAWYLSLTPGITGLWQVRGRNGLSMDERTALDVSYARQVSLTMDLDILRRTVGVVLSRSGV